MQPQAHRGTSLTTSMSMQQRRNQIKHHRLRSVYVAVLVVSQCDCRPTRVRLCVCVCQKKQHFESKNTQHMAINLQSYKKDSPARRAWIFHGRSASVTCSHVNCTRTHVQQTTATNLIYVCRLTICLLHKDIHQSHLNGLITIVDTLYSAMLIIIMECASALYTGNRVTYFAVELAILVL